MYDRHRRVLHTAVESARACCPPVRAGVLCTVGFAAALLAGCGELEPMREPDVIDLELTTDTLKASVRDAQRTVAELRADLEARRRELAEAQVARAQLEGRVREAERRVLEARQVIELQREELAVARTERERVFRSSLQLQSQMKQLRKQHSKAVKSSPAQNGSEAVLLPSSGEERKTQKAMQTPAKREPALEIEQQGTLPQHVSVKPGDTLWSIAQKYRVTVEHLRKFNQLPDNRIVIGQALWLPDDRPVPVVGAGRGTAMP